jgi:hypothetical protein
MTEQKATKSRFGPINRYLYSSDDYAINAIVTYDMRPERLQKIGASAGLPLGIWNIISEFCTRSPEPITFELWREPETGNIALNWFGTWTYGTSWMFGSNVWLTPAAGLCINVTFEHETKSAIRRHVRDQWRARQIATKFKAKYDTRQPLFGQYDNPGAVAKILAFGTSYTANIDIGHQLYTRRKTAAQYLKGLATSSHRRPERLSAEDRAYGMREGRNIIVYHVPDDRLDPIDRPSVILMYNSDKPMRELNYIHDLGEVNHGVSFYRSRYI